MKPVNTRSGSLLIVDDNEALTQFSAWEFEDLGYRVNRAANCRQARRLAQATRFDFALVDYHLPDGNGRALSHLLKRRLPRLQLVMMSADRAGATARGIDPAVMCTFVEKPVPTARLHRLFSISNKPTRGEASPGAY